MSDYEPILCSRCKRIHEPGCESQKERIEILRGWAEDSDTLRAHAARLEGEVERLKIERDEAKDLADGFQSEAADLRGEVEEERSRRGRAEVNMDAALRAERDALKAEVERLRSLPADPDRVEQLQRIADGHATVALSALRRVGEAESRAARLEGERDAARERFAKVQFWEDKIDTLTAERDAARGSLRECVEELALEEDRRIRRCEAAGSATGHGYSESHRCSGSTADLLNRARATIAKVGGCWRCGNAEQPGFLVLAGRGGALIPCPYCRPGKAVEWMADAAPRRESK